MSDLIENDQNECLDMTDSNEGEQFQLLTLNCSKDKIYVYNSVSTSVCDEVFIEYDVTEMNPPNVDRTVQSFIDDCLKHHLFDNTFYDYNNMVSILATKLPQTFCKMSNYTDSITKQQFIDFFTSFGFSSDLEQIFAVFIKKSVNELTWFEFRDFFLPFICNVSNASKNDEAQ